MSYLAFTYKQYDNYGGIRNNFRGTFGDKEDLLKCVKGDRYDYLYLEILDTDTLAFEEYIWHPHYIYEDRRCPDGTYDHDKRWLVKVWYHKPSEWTEVKWRDDGKLSETMHQIMYESGYWADQERDDPAEDEHRLSKELKALAPKDRITNG